MGEDPTDASDVTWPAVKMDHPDYLVIFKEAGPPPSPGHEIIEIPWSEIERTKGETK